MKTKHILTALALPAMFAACTADDIVSVESGMQQERAKLSENFVLKVGTDAVESRYDANGGAPKFETGDKIGAALIDQFLANKPVTSWPIITSLASNTPFTYDENTDEWNVPESQPMGIGNYFFKFPYDKNDRSRAAVIYTLPTIQKQYTDVDGAVDTDAIIEDANLAIATAVINEDDEMSNISMKNIFTYPKFRIQFDNGQKVNTVSKVVLFKHNGTTNATVVEDGFIVKSGFDHKKVVQLFNDKLSSYYVSNKEKVTDWNKVETRDLIYTTNPFDGVAKVEKSTYLIAQLPNDAEVSYDSNTDNKYIDVRFVLPALEKKSDLDMGMYIYTDNGMYTIADVESWIKFKETTDVDVRNAVFARNKNYNLTLKALTQTDDEAKMIVSNNEEWNNLVDVYGNMKKTYNVVLVGDQFGFDETTDMPAKATFKIEGDATVKGDATLSHVKVTGTTYVEKGATLTTSGSFETGKIENEGDVVIPVVLDEEEDVVDYNKVDKIINKSTLTIEKKAEATFHLFNAEGATVDIYGKATLSNATLTVEKDGTVDYYYGNWGEVNNEGTIIANGFRNNSYWDDEEEGRVYAVINNNAKFMADNYSNFINDGKFINEGSLTSNSKKGYVINDYNGIIDSKKDATTYVSSNYGEIYVYVANPNDDVVIAKDGNVGTIGYKAENASENFDKSIVNKVVVDGDLTFTKMGNVKTLVVEDDATLTFPAEAALTSVTVEAGETAFASNVTIDRLVVEKDAEVYVNSAKTVYAKDLDNDGAILVAGVFMSDEPSNVGDGTVEEAGWNNEGQVIWNVKGTADVAAAKAAAKTAYVDALAEAIEAWIEDDNKEYAGGVYVAKYDLYAENEDDKNIAAGAFGKYYEDSKDATWNLSPVMKALENKLNTYNGYLDTDVIVTSEWASAVAIAIEHLQAGGCGNDADGNLIVKWDNDLTNLTWSPVEQNRVFLDTEDATAEGLALKALKAAVAEGLILDGTEAMSNVKKVLFNTATKAEDVAEAAPAQSIVFAEDAIYKIFGNEGIALVLDWKLVDSQMTDTYAATLGNKKSWDLALVKSWINEVATKLQYNNNLYVEVAREYVKDNDLINVSKAWKYDDEIIKQIVESYGREDIKAVKNGKELSEALESNKSVRLEADVETALMSEIGGNVAIDLNGYTLTYTKNDRLIRVNNGGNLTINGETKGSAIKASFTPSNDNDAAYIASVNEGGKLLVNGGEYEVEGEVCFLSNGGELHIVEGTFEAKKSYNGQYFTINYIDKYAEEGLITVSGGTFINFNPAATASESPIANLLEKGKSVKVLWKENGNKDITNDVPTANYTDKTKKYCEQPYTEELKEAGFTFIYNVE